ncbi:Erythromycin C-12 hydroxylase [Novipirellula aureliae]|uniref:Erythromycin C-12 hydroxylase n=1 Tax=Novipirellula aureliae TaxID=2527966 RepID=A0A5C6EA07_9BACT|nr:cytochrome P450 [Novipirellula aureliae]TWU45842.1 Erythromycin C-12 hydroxylase [Novipirellula aureliae]
MTRQPDWNPKSTEVLYDQRAAYDKMRKTCPVAYSEMLGWSLFRHQDIRRVLDDHETFSSNVSRHISVPNGMDPPEHTKFRKLIEPLFRPEPMAAFEPKCRAITGTLFDSLLARTNVEFLFEFARPFAVRTQCESVGWHESMYEPLRDWTRKNQEATFAQNRNEMKRIAEEFEGFVAELLDQRRRNPTTDEHDVITSLLEARVDDRPLRNEEIVSILRNWTVGEIGTISAAIGILAHALATHLDVQERLREQPDLIPSAIEEILRAHGPLVANRRVTTCPVTMGGRKIEAGERISMNWISANRDERVFDDADQIRLDRDPSANLLWGAGIHGCPGAPLARLEMRVAIEELLKRTTQIKLNERYPATLATFPASGFATLPVTLRR